MNFKTTLVLLVLLLLLGGYLLATYDRGGGAVAPASPEASVDGSGGRKLFDFDKSAITRVAVNSAAAGETLVLEKSGDTWHLKRPVDAVAETFEVDGLLDALAELRSRGQVPRGSAVEASTGLAQPAQTVEVMAAGKTYIVKVGNRSTVGDNLYVSTGDSSIAEVVPTTLAELLAKPASNFRKRALVEAPVSEVRGVTITKPDGTRLVLHREADKWSIIEPEALLAEKTLVDDMVLAITGLRSEDFVSESATAEGARYGLESPQLVATLSAEPPATQPAATQPATDTAAGVTTVTIGRYDDVRKQNVFVRVSGSETIVKVPAKLIERLDKRPIDLRSQAVFAAPPDEVTQIEIAADLAATTQPIPRRASSKKITIQRRAPAATTAPSTMAAAETDSSTAAPKWDLITPAGRTAADEVKVDMLLKSFNPLYATKYLEALPTTQQARGTYTVRIISSSQGAKSEHVLTLRDIDPDGSPVGTYGDLIFRVDQNVLRLLELDFTAPPTP